MENREAEEFLTGVLRAALISCAGEPGMTVGATVEGCGTFFAKVLAEAILIEGGTSAEMEDRLMNLTAVLLDEARIYVRDHRRQRRR